MKPRAYVFIFDGLADWEPVLALCEIRRSGKYEVLAAANSSKTVVTRGGRKSCLTSPLIGSSPKKRRFSSCLAATGGKSRRPQGGRSSPADWEASTSPARSSEGWRSETKPPPRCGLTCSRTA